MLSRRIIACLDVRDGEVVKGVNFADLRQAGRPADLAARYNAEGIDELVLLDVTATLEGRGAMLETVREVSRHLFIPLTVGGGIRSIDDARAVVEAGADKISVNSAALRDPALITSLARLYGSQAVIVAIDARRGPAGYAGPQSQRHIAGAARGDRLGARSHGAGRGRDPADVDRPRRHQDRLRLRAHRRRERRRAHSRHRVRRRRLAGTLCRGLHDRPRRCGACRVRVSFLRARRAGSQTVSGRPGRADATRLVRTC